MDLIHQYWSDTGVIKLRIPPTLANSPVSLLLKNIECDEEQKIKMMQKGRPFSSETHYVSSQIHHAFRLVPLDLRETDMRRKVDIAGTT